MSDSFHLNRGGSAFMDRKISRREFLFSRGLFKSRKLDCNSDLDQYFRSSLYSYPFVQDMPWDIISEEAERTGIAVIGRSKADIVLELLRKQGER